MIWDKGERTKTNLIVNNEILQDVKEFPYLWN